VLTVCGGLAGAIISGAVTVYEIERQAQQIGVPPPGMSGGLVVNTEQIVIDDSQAAQLDPGHYFVEEGLGFALPQPLPGWKPLEQMQYADLFAQDGTLSTLIFYYGSVGGDWDAQPVYRIRHEQPARVRFGEDSTENGLPVDMEVMRSALGSDTAVYYPQMTLLTVDKSVAARTTLPEVALTWGEAVQSGINRIFAAKNSPYILLQATSQLQDVRVGGQDTDCAIERWALFAEGSQRYYILEVQYLPQGEEANRIRENLQTYIDSFRVIR